jgi:hypothetical protein
MASQDYGALIEQSGSGGGASRQRDNGGGKSHLWLEGGAMAAVDGKVRV